MQHNIDCRKHWCSWNSTGRTGHDGHGIKRCWIARWRRLSYSNCRLDIVSLFSPRYGHIFELFSKKKVINKNNWCNNSLELNKDSIQNVKYKVLQPTIEAGIKTENSLIVVVWIFFKSTVNNKIDLCFTQAFNTEQSHNWFCRS